MKVKELLDKLELMDEEAEITGIHVRSPNEETGMRKVTIYSDYAGLNAQFTFEFKPDNPFKVKKIKEVEPLAMNPINFKEILAEGAAVTGTSMTNKVFKTLLGRD